VGTLADSENKPNFWTSLPGFMTGLAALLTAVTGLLVVMYQHSQAKPTADPAPVTTKDAAGGNTSSASTEQKPVRQIVLVVGKDGTETKVFPRNFEDSYSGKAFQFKNGQSVPFERIKSVDFMDQRGSEQDIKVTLRDGRDVAGAIMSGEQLTGATDIGPVSISVKDVKRIEFER
jgi:hypothetical protein